MLNHLLLFLNGAISHTKGVLNAGDELFNPGEYEGSKFDFVVYL